VGVNIEPKNLGLDLAVFGTAISIIGVIYNNVFLEHTTAMWIWVFSNAIFVVYFWGRTQKIWDGGLSDGLLCMNYVVMLVTGLWGLMK
jgi:hypothetical protein